MKRFNKLSRDTRPQEQPSESYPFAKNGIQNFVKGAVINEPGFLPSSAVIPYTPMGVIETDKFPVIFSTNNIYSAFGFYNSELDQYTPIFNDVDQLFKLGFSTDFFITGEAQRNYKGELVGAFTDKRLSPFYVNFDNPDIESFADMMLFPDANPPTVDTAILTGGLLPFGAYYASVKYVKNDGTETSFLTTSSPKVITGNPNEISDKGIEIRITNADIRYDKLQVAIISKVNGILKAVQLTNPIPISGNGIIFYSGAELTEPITLEEILTPMPTYKSVGAMGQLNDALYLVDLKSPQPVRMQKYVNLMRLKWHSRLISVSPVYEKMKSGEEKTFMHAEVAVFYIRFKLNTGNYTQSFVIPGPALTSADLASSSQASAEGITAKVFQVQDTITTFNTAGKWGHFGKWQNETETFPDTDDFDSSSIGGPNLRNQPVTHHRFPSIRWCKQNLYAGDVSYARDKLDMLGISVENLIIPTEYQNQIVGWEIFYAKRSIGNSTVLGQSLLLFGHRNKYEPLYNPSTYYSTGGNWDTDIRFKSTDRMRLHLDQSVFRFHAFDILFNKPSISDTASYLNLEVGLSRQNIPQTGGYIEDGSIKDHNDASIIFALDYIQKGSPATIPVKKIKAIKNTTYVPNHLQLGKWNNLGLEGCLGGNISVPESLVGSWDWLEVAPDNRDIGATKDEFSVHYENTYLTNLMALRKDLYVPFTGQSLVRTAQSSSVQSTDIFFGGDSYICDYSFHTYGAWVSNEPNTAEQLLMGTKVVRRFICETAANLYGRFEDPANPYSRYYPKSSLTKDPSEFTVNYLEMFSRDKDPNQFGYIKDSSAQDDLIVSDIFNAFADDIYDHPYRIHRGGKLSRQTKFRSWRTFLPLDYYEMQKNMGRPVNLEGMDDRLLIHCENALFLTQDKAKLESDILSVTLGTGDIFQFEPQEALSAPLGYAGTQHQLACVRTPAGYVFIDSKAGQIFLYKGQLELFNNMLNTFFAEFLRLKENNVFVGNGYTIGYDPEYKRLLLTVKNRQLNTAQQVPQFSEEMLTTLDPGDIVYKNGRLQRFLGINDESETGYECPDEVIPTAQDLIVTIPESTPVGTVIGTVTGTDVDNFYILGDSSPFYLNPTTGQVRVVGGLNYYAEDEYTFTGSAQNDNGNHVPFTVVINITAVNRPPEAEDAEVNITDNTPSSTAILTVVATDRESNPLTYTIVGGNTDNTFSINASTGVISVADGTNLNGLTIPRYELLINVSDGTGSDTATVGVNITHVNAPPITEDYSITIDDNTSSNSIVLTMDPAVDPENDTLVYSLVSESVPGVFSFNPITLEIKLIDNAQLNPAAINQYTLLLSASDGTHEPVPFNVTINIIYNRRNLNFVPDQLACSVPIPECEEGWTLSDDESVCVRVTTTEPDITQAESCLAASTNGVYGEYGARIYNEGFDNASIDMLSPPSDDIFALLPTGFWIGINNMIGVWVDTDCDGTKDALADGARTTILYNFGNTGAARTVYAGVFGDNEFVLKVNEAEIAATTVDFSDRNFKVLHIFPVNVINGQNLFNVEATGDGSVNDAMGLIIFDNTPEDIEAATGLGDLNVVFTSEDLRGTSTTIATCPTGYVLDIVGGVPICKMIETATPGGSSTYTATWPKVKVVDTKRSTQISLLNNDETEKFFQGIEIPYYPDIVNFAGCGGTVIAYYNVLKFGTAQKIDCEEGVGSVVEYAVPPGLYRTTTNQLAADALAQADVTTNKQDYANSNGQCIEP